MKIMYFIRNSVLAMKDSLIIKLIFINYMKLKKNDAVNSY